VILGYLPERLSEDELRALVDEAVTRIGAEGMRDMGKVMGILMPEVRGRADGQIVNRLVKEHLQTR
jgi:uncharacterized protein YqeY